MKHSEISSNVHGVVIHKLCASSYCWLAFHELARNLWISFFHPTQLRRIYEFTLNGFKKDCALLSDQQPTPLGTDTLTALLTEAKTRSDTSINMYLFQSHSFWRSRSLVWLYGAVTTEEISFAGLYICDGRRWPGCSKVSFIHHLLSVIKWVSSDTRRWRIHVCCVTFSSSSSVGVNGFSL